MQRGRAEQISYELLAPYFQENLDVVASKVVRAHTLLARVLLLKVLTSLQGLSKTALKAAMKKLGIDKWPAGNGTPRRQTQVLNPSLIPAHLVHTHVLHGSFVMVAHTRRQPSRHVLGESFALPSLTVCPPLFLLVRKPDAERKRFSKHLPGRCTRKLYAPSFIRARLLLHLVCNCARCEIIVTDEGSALARLRCNLRR